MEATPVSLSAIVEKYESELMEKGHIIKTAVNLKKYEDVNAKNSLIDIVLSNMIENAVLYTEEKYAEIFCLSYLSAKGEGDKGGEVTNISPQPPKSSII